MVSSSIWSFDSFYCASLPGTVVLRSGSEMCEMSVPSSVYKWGEYNTDT